MKSKRQRANRRRGQRAIKPVGAVAKENLTALAARAAKGDRLAARELYSCATLATELLNFVGRQKLQLVRPIAREKIVWPVLYSRHQESRKEADALMSKLDVGDASGFNISGIGKSFSWETPAVKIAYHLIRLVRLVKRRSVTDIRPDGSVDLSPLAALRVGWRSPRMHVYDEKYEKQLRELEEWGQKGPGSELPPLTRDTAGQWAKAIGKPFRIIFGIDYERHFRLADLRASIGTWHGGIGILRSRMLNEVKQAIKSLAPLK